MIRPAVRPLALASLLVVAGCATAPRGAAPAAPGERPADMREAGLERVVGHTAADLAQLFGEPDLDQREGSARRLQFVGPVCVLDAYLAAPREGREPVVTYVDARLPSGDDIDRASCVAALSRRAAAR